MTSLKSTISSIEMDENKCPKRSVGEQMAYTLGHDHAIKEASEAVKKVDEAIEAAYQAMDEALAELKDLNPDADGAYARLIEAKAMIKCATKKE